MGRTDRWGDRRRARARQGLLWSSAVLFSACVSVCGAAEPTVEEVLARHCRAREEAVALRTDFVQRKLFTLIEEEETSKGSLYFRRPDRILWKYREPDESWTVIKGREGWSVFPRIKQVQKFALDGSRSNEVLSIVGFGSCGSSLSDSFRISLTIGKDRALVLAMIPITEDIARYFSKVDLTLDRGDYLPRKIVLHEIAEDLLIFNLGDPDVNPEIDDAMFKYDVPKGYEVVDYSTGRPGGSGGE